ncbi:MAG: FAD-dependent oxidoreductase, partial [Candidatus Woesearchaeota archaeon]
NTNFALLSRVSLTKPLTDTHSYGVSIARLTTTLGGGKPILQRYGDLIKGRRSTWGRLEKTYVEPTLKDVTPGDISMALPKRILVNLIESMEALNKVIPGVASDSTLLYAPEIKLFSARISSDKNMQTQIKGLYVAGDGAGVSGNIVGAAATGIIAAKSIKK